MNAIAADQLVQGEVDIHADRRRPCRVGFGTTHPHRDLPNEKVQKARERGERVFADELTRCYNSGGGTSMVWSADPNGAFPTMIRHEKTAIVHGGTRDCIRYKSHPDGAQLQLLKTGVRRLTIDPHQMLWARFLVSWGHQRWWLTFVQANLGRGYQPGELRRNVLSIMEFADGREHVVLGLQEIDEDDRAPELRVIKQEMEHGTRLVGGRELLALSPGFDDVVRERSKVTMGSGLEIGAPAGTGPTRHAVTAVGLMR